MLGVSRGVLGGGGAVAAPAAAQKLLGEWLDRVEARRGCVAVHGRSVGEAACLVSDVPWTPLS